MSAFFIPLLRVLGLVLVTMVLACAYLLSQEEALIFHPSRQPVGGSWAPPPGPGGPGREVWLEPEGGPRLHAWWIPAEASRGTLLFFHGNAGNLSGRGVWARALASLGVDVLLVDYPGYGRSEGQPTGPGVHLTAEAAWDHAVHQLGVDPSRIIAYGKSLGGAAATHLAATRKVGALVLQSAFTSIPDMAREVYPWLPAHRLVRTRLDNRARLAEVTVPCLVLHSQDDDLIPYWMAEANAAACKGPTTLKGWPGAGHNDLIDREARGLLDALHGLLNQVLGSREADRPTSG